MKWIFIVVISIISLDTIPGKQRVQVPVQSVQDSLKLESDSLKYELDSLTLNMDILLNLLEQKAKNKKK